MNRFRKDQGKETTVSEIIKAIPILRPTGSRWEICFSFWDPGCKALVVIVDPDVQAAVEATAARVHEYRRGHVGISGMDLARAPDGIGRWG